MTTQSAKVDIFAEERVLRWLADHPEDVHLFPNFDSYITDYRIAVAKAIKKIAEGMRNNYKPATASTIATLAAREGWPRATTENVQELLDRGNYEINVFAMCEYLQSLHGMRSFEEVNAKIWNDVQLRKKTPIEAAEEQLQALYASNDASTHDLWTAERWLEERGESLAAERAALKASGQLFGWIPEWENFSQAIKTMEHGQIFLLADTSVGKTGGALALAAYLAAKGDKVLFCMNEANEDEMNWRLLSMLSGDPYVDFVNGAWMKEKYQALRRRFKNLVFWPAGNKPLTMLLAQAEKMGAHCVVDVFPSVNYRAFTKEAGGNQTSGIDAALSYIDAWCQRKKPGQVRKLFIGTLQRDKSSRSGGEMVNASDAKGTGDYVTKAAIYITATAKRVTKAGWIDDPIRPGKEIFLKKGMPHRVMIVRLDKNRFGPRFVEEVIYFDADCMRWYPLSGQQAVDARNKMEEMTAPLSSYEH